MLSNQNLISLPSDHTFDKKKYTKRKLTFCHYLCLTISIEFNRLLVNSQHSSSKGLSFTLGKLEYHSKNSVKLRTSVLVAL